MTRVTADHAPTALGQSAPRLTSLHKTDEDECGRMPTDELEHSATRTDELGHQTDEDGYQTNELVNSDALTKLYTTSTRSQLWVRFSEQCPGLGQIDAPPTRAGRCSR